MHGTVVNSVLFHMWRRNKTKVNIPTKQIQFTLVFIFLWDLEDFYINNLHYFFNPFASQPHGSLSNLTDQSVTINKEERIHTKASNFRVFFSCFPKFIWLLMCVKLFVIPDRPMVQSADFLYFVVNIRLSVCQESLPINTEEGFVDQVKKRIPNFNPAYFQVVGNHSLVSIDFFLVEMSRVGVRAVS